MGNKYDHVKSEYYAPFLTGNGRRFNNNPTNNRYGVLQRMYMRILTEMAANRFKWQGLPESIDVRFMELQLFYTSLAVFYFDFTYGKYLALAGTPNGQWNMMQQPTAFTVTGNMFTGKRLTTKQCIPIWGNYLRVPDLDIVMIYASKLADIDLSIEIASHNARRTKVLVYDENSRLSAENINRQIDEGQPTISIASGAGERVIDSIQALDLGIEPDAIEKLHIVRTRLWSECMGLLGIDNANQDKKERLVSDEVDANREQVSSMKAVNLNARQTAAHQINLRYNLNVSVEYNSDNSDELGSIDMKPAEAVPTSDDYKTYPKHIAPPVEVK